MMVSPKDAARAAYKDPELSMRVHDVNESNQDHNENYNIESRAHSTLTNRAIIFAGLQGCSVASALLSIVRLLPRCVGGFCQGNNTNSRSSTTCCCRSSSSVGSDSGIRGYFSRAAVCIPVIAAAAIPSSISLGYIIWSSFACERLFECRERDRERWEMQNYPEGEIAEMVNIYKHQGLSSEDAKQVVEIFSKDDEVFLNLMMVEELGYSRHGMPSSKETFLRASLPAMISHGLCVAAPLLPWMFFPSHHPIEFGEGVLLTQTLALSVGQGMILYGAYADVWNTLPLVIRNTAWLTGLFLGTRAAVRWWLPS